MDLERLVLRAVFLAQFGQPCQQPGKVGGVAPTVQPAGPIDGGSLQSGLVVASDEDRHGGTGCRAYLDGWHVEDLAVELEETTGHQPAHDGDLLVHPLAPACPGHTANLIVLGPRARADTEQEPVVGQHRGRADLLRDEHRLADRQLDHERDEAEILGQRPHGGNERERLQERLVLEEFPGPVRVEGGGGVRHLRVADAVGHDHGVVARRLGGLGQREVEGRVRHRLGIRETHCTSGCLRGRARLPCGPCPLILPGPMRPGTTVPSEVVRRPWSPTFPCRTSSTPPDTSSARWPTPTTRAVPKTSACCMAMWRPGATGSCIRMSWPGLRTSPWPPPCSAPLSARPSSSPRRQFRGWLMPRARWPLPGAQRRWARCSSCPRSRPARSRTSPRRRRTLPAGCRSTYCGSGRAPRSWCNAPPPTATGRSS